MRAVSRGDGFPGISELPLGQPRARLQAEECSFWSQKTSWWALKWCPWVWGQGGSSLFTLKVFSSLRITRQGNLGPHFHPTITGLLWTSTWFSRGACKLPLARPVEQTPPAVGLGWTREESIEMGGTARFPTLCSAPSSLSYTVFSLSKTFFLT